MIADLAGQLPGWVQGLFSNGQAQGQTKEPDGPGSLASLLAPAGEGAGESKGSGAAGLLPAVPFGSAARPQAAGEAPDRVDISPETAFSLQYARSQFEVNVSALRAINTAQGVETQAFHFSLRASFETLQVASGQEPVPWGETAPAASADPLKQMMDFFSPEKTAERILDFALSFFPQSRHLQEGGDTEAARSDCRVSHPIRLTSHDV